MEPYGPDYATKWTNVCASAQEKHNNAKEDVRLSHLAQICDP